MRHATKSPCDKSQACLIGAGGVRGVTESHVGCVCARYARREAAERHYRGRRALLSHKGTIISYLATLERYFRRRSGERPLEIQILPLHAGYSLVIHIANNNKRTRVHVYARS